jgi:uncharacterized membrane protein YozB (DUF420 family)
VNKPKADIGAHVRWPLMVFVGLCLLIGVGSSASFYLREPANAGFADYPTITALHVVLGGAYLLLAPLQFVSRIRKRWPKVHRWNGRLLVAIGMIVGVTALLMNVLIPYSGLPQQIVLTPFAVLFSLSILMGLRHIRAGRVVQHKEWMLRAFAIGLAIATMRLIFIPFLLIIGTPTQSQVEAGSLVSFTVAFVAHLVVAELWIRRARYRQTDPSHGLRR